MMNKKMIFWILVSLMLIGISFAEDVYIFKLSIKNGKVIVVDKQLAAGNVPKTFDGGNFIVKGSDSTTIATGKFSLPSGTIMEKFHNDNSIEGTFVPANEVFVILPAFENAAKVELFDEKNVKLTEVDVAGMEKSSYEAASEDELKDAPQFLLKYEWVLLILKYLIIIAAIILVLVWLIKKFRKKQN